MAHDADATLSLFARRVADACGRLWRETGRPPASVQLVFYAAGAGWRPHARPLQMPATGCFETRLEFAIATCLATASEHPNAVVFSDIVADGGAVAHTVLHDGRALYLMTQTLQAAGAGEPRLAVLEMAGTAPQ